MIRSYESTLGRLLIAKRGYDGMSTGMIKNDSRQVLPGDVFVAISGAVADGHDFIRQALAAGATTIVHTKDLENYSDRITYLQVSDSTRAYSRLLRAHFGKPDLEVPLFGITGTNGKTTSAFIIAHLFQHADIPCGLFSTVEYRDGKTVTRATHTTPDAGQFFPRLRTMRNNGMKAAVMEVSSHALAQGRIAGAKFHTAIFTNLTGDHLDYHGSMEEYYQAKRRLFSELFSPDGTAVVNVDDPFGKRLAEELGSREMHSFGQSPAAEWVIHDVELRADGTRFVLSNENTVFPVETNLIGEHNVYNLTGAILAVRNYGLSWEQIAYALSQEITVPGRLQKFSAQNGADFYVDYAHTDDALKNVLAILRKICRNKLTVVFGAGGDRDRSKRPRMGKVAAEMADAVILTSDNPRTEDPMEIIREIACGMPQEKTPVIEPDRRKAIACAAAQAAPGDVILIAGKGHENYQIIGTEKSHLDDREVIADLLKRQQIKA